VGWLGVGYGVEYKSGLGKNCFAMWKVRRSCYFLARYGLFLSESFLCFRHAGKNLKGG
jgi:hypothetical protein